ncbi:MULTISPECIES: hypothetical protein [Streptomyces]|uniref:hypothetical protein n=1 Tax=Streptomyces lycopersici TaxID=2974589 RepID=UPI0021D2D930|nr:hypothetical protein [Streptomyces sp. NEAU-383]
MGGIDWGDAPTWVAGAFAAAAAYYARGTLRSQQKQIREQREFIAEQSATMALERAELLAQAEERRTAQARRVSMKHSLSWTNDAEGFGGRNDHWKVRVINTSDEPIRDVLVRFGDTYDARDATTPGQRGWGPGRVHLIGPGREFTFRSQRMPEVLLENARPDLYFTDANGVRWQLDAHGELGEGSEAS